jgi:hypothetical protein
MNQADLALRNHLYRRFVELGRAPRFEQLGNELEWPREDVAAGMRRLHEAHALVLDPSGTRILMAAPFSAVQTPHHVTARGREWYGNCAWDAFGVIAALGGDGHIASACLDCNAPVEIDVRGGEPVRDDHVVHINVPAAHWWDDAVFT